MNSKLTSLAGDLKGTLIVLLAKTETLSAKQAYNAVLKEGLGVSYQAAHKMLNEMLSDGIVLKKDGDYALSKAWLLDFGHELSELSSSAESKSFSFYPPNTAKISSTFRALSLLKQMLFDRHLSFSKDEFYIDGNRVVMVPLRLYFYWYAKIKKSLGNDYVYSSCRDLGIFWFKKLRENRITRGNVEEEIQLGINTLNLAGWGSMNMARFDPVNKLITATLDHSSFAAEYLRLNGTSKKPVDDWVRGAVCGSMSVILGEPTLEAKETQCIACGDRQCVFEFKPRKLFDRKNNAING